VSSSSKGTDRPVEHVGEAHQVIELGVAVGGQQLGGISAKRLGELTPRQAPVDAGELEQAFLVLHAP
jgi:hypothetical protein